MADASLTWLGHATFRLDSPGGKRIYVDPWLENPKCPDAEKEPERCDVIAITHGHSDHVGQTVELSNKFGPLPIVAMVELKGWLKNKGAKLDELPGPNKGGTVEAEGVKFTLTHAFHSSSSDELDYLGEAAGVVVELENGTKVYFAGDTCVFGDMQLIGRIYAPDVAVLPIGGHFTMDPREAAVACELLGVNRVVPCHYGTFPLLAGTPDELRQLAEGVQVEAVDPGGTVEL
ncbi:MAG TPA: metal-dependent hydrolase [Actinomycetota bacterium]|jgi:L-ascorbate metabolism protein UlaG (beta-lactamase superfamily)|nr:metal-dependent hydrolase [Actinomycetota bacterium]